MCLNLEIVLSKQSLGVGGVLSAQGRGLSPQHKKRSEGRKARRNRYSLITLRNKPSDM